MFRNGINPVHVVKVGKDANGLRPRLTAAQQREIISAIRKRYAGTMNHGEPLILDNLIEDVQKLSNTPAEMDWLNSGKSTKSRIAQGFGTNPIIMGKIEGANRASAVIADNHFCSFTVNPKIELISQVLTEYLSPMFGGDLVIWIEPCQANDTEMKLKYLELLGKHSAITGGEMRELSPFDLKLGDFSDPVASTGGRITSQALEALQESVRSIDPKTFANRIVDQSKAIPSKNGNGRCSNVQ